MAERDLYLRSILGKGALTIHTFRSPPLILGGFSWIDGVAPLGDATQQAVGAMILSVTQEHRAGHFLGPETLPAYRMIELGALLGEGQRVIEVSNAGFRRIVRPGDVITAVKDESLAVKLLREFGDGVQEVAQANIAFAEQGLNPHEIGIVLEVAAQTIVANMARRRTSQPEHFFPLILGVGNITVVDSSPIKKLIIIPTALIDFDERAKFTASAEVKGGGGELVASVTDIQFQFATEAKIRAYDSYGRSHL